MTGKLQVRRRGEKITAILITARSKHEALTRLTEVQLANPADRPMLTINQIASITYQGKNVWEVRPL